MKDETKVCNNAGCKNNRLCPHNGWWGGPNIWCWECIKKVDEAADAMRDEITCNRLNGLNDSGTLTRVEDEAKNPSYERADKQ